MAKKRIYPMTKSDKIDLKANYSWHLDGIEPEYWRVSGGGNSTMCIVPCDSNKKDIFDTPFIEADDLSDYVTKLEQGESIMGDE